MSRARFRPRLEPLEAKESPTSLLLSPGLDPLAVAAWTAERDRHRSGPEGGLFYDWALGKGDLPDGLYETHNLQASQATILRRVHPDRVEVAVLTPEVSGPRPWFGKEESEGYSTTFYLPGIYAVRDYAEGQYGDPYLVLLAAPSADEDGTYDCCGGGPTSQQQYGGQLQFIGVPGPYDLYAVGSFLGAGPKPRDAVRYASDYAPNAVMVLGMIDLGNAIHAKAQELGRPIDVVLFAISREPGILGPTVNVGLDRLYRCTDGEFQRPYNDLAERAAGDVRLLRLITQYVGNDFRGETDTDSHYACFANALWNDTVPVEVGGWTGDVWALQGAHGFHVLRSSTYQSYQLDAPI